MKPGRGIYVIKSCNVNWLLNMQISTLALVDASLGDVIIVEENRVDLRLCCENIPD